jgi:hypothetical protein
VKVSKEFDLGGDADDLNLTKFNETSDKQQQEEIEKSITPEKAVNETATNSTVDPAKPAMTPEEARIKAEINEEVLGTAKPNLTAPVIPVEFNKTD